MISSMLSIGRAELLGELLRIGLEASSGSLVRTTVGPILAAAVLAKTRTRRVE
jgi:hypothetical protein